MLWSSCRNWRGEQHKWCTHTWPLPSKFKVAEEQLILSPLALWRSCQPIQAYASIWNTLRWEAGRGKGEIPD
jgi:hypothetical protein